MTSRATIRVAWISLMSVTALGLVTSGFDARAAEPATGTVPKAQKERRVRQDTNHLVHRVSTMLRVLDYYGADRRAERQVLGEVATVLAGLSQAQMAEVIARLDAAAQIPDSQKANKEVSEAYQQHRIILARLRALLARYQAIQNLDRAAARLDQASKEQLAVRLHTNQLVHEYPTAPAYAREPMGHTQPAIMEELHQQADDQADLGQEVRRVFQELGQLSPRLPAAEKERIRQAEQFADGQHLLNNIRQASQDLRRWSGQNLERWRHAGALQRQAATDLQDLARILRTPSDRLTALREARERINRVLAKQEDLMQDADTQKDPRVQDRERLRQQRGQPRQAQEQGDEQGRLQHETHGAREVLQLHALELADHLDPAEQAMQRAERQLRKNSPEQAVPPQQEAADTLRAVRRDLDQAIATAEKEQHDPLAALQKKAEAVEQLLKEQKDLRQDTEEAHRTGHSGRLRQMTAEQHDLAERTADAKHQASPAKPAAQQALDRASEAMHTAAEALAAQQGQKATAKQDQAIHALEEAKRHLDEQAAAIQKRRDDTAALEDAQRRLQHLAKQESHVADQAHALDRDHDQAKKNSGARQLETKQKDIKAQTQPLGKEIEHAAADAARNVAEAAKNMEAAQKNLEQHQPAPAAGQAEQAAAKLNKSAQAVAKALKQQQAEETAEQAAMQPNELDPENAADQLAKAVEEARQAAQHSAKAAAQSGSQKAHEPNKLAHLQKQVADRAAALKLPSAHKPADAAAKALSKGSLEHAIKQQKQALARLQQAAHTSNSPPEHSHSSNPSDPAHAQDAAGLAKAQKALLNATQALARSQEATQAAQAALEQARAQAPQNVQPALREADKALAKAGQELHQVQPQPAHESQEQAIAQMTQALGALQAAAKAMPKSGAPSGQPTRAQAKLPGQAQMQPGQPRQSQGNQRQPGMQPRGRSDGARLTRAMPPHSEPARLGDVVGEGAFLHLPPRQRELIKQALNATLPPEYAPVIQQYYVNIARGKPAARPRPPEKP